MSVGIACLVLIIGFAINLPVFIAVISSNLAYFFLAGDANPMIAAQRIIGASENTTLLAIPFFIFLGNLLNHAGITRRLLQLSDVLTGHMKGGLAQSNVMLSTLMGGMSASNVADCAMLCKMLVPEMTRLGYGKAFSTAVTAAGSLITPIIPPGMALIIYAYVADVSVGKMFMSGVIPGLMCCAALMTTIGIVSRRRNYKPSREHGPTWPEFWAACKAASGGLSLVIVILGGIRFGIFTATEAGAMAVAYVIFLGAVVYRELKFEHFKQALLETTQSTATIMLIIMACSALAWLFTWEQISQSVAAFITGFSKNPYVFLMVLNGFLLFLGMFIEGNAAIIVLVPLLMPTVKLLGIDPIHFGLVMIFNLAMGCLTPPMGTVMFVANSITGTKVGEFCRAGVPLYIALFICLLLFTFFPAISTWLPYL